MGNPILNTKLYAKVTGVVLALVAVLGAIFSLANDGAFIDNFLAFDWTHNVVHFVLAAVALYIGFMATGNLANLYAKAFGIVYLALGVVGFIPAVNDALASALLLEIELGENLVHLLIGAWGIAAGFFGTATGAPSPGMGTTGTTGKTMTTTGRNK